MSAREIDLRNAACRARWVQRFYSGTVCGDAWKPYQRAWFDHYRIRAVRRAQAWIDAGKKFNRAREIAKHDNVLELPLPSLLQRQGG